MTLPEGTSYLAPQDFQRVLAKCKYAGQAWKHKHQWTTYRPSNKVAYKNLRVLQPKNQEDFWNIMRTCREAGIKPPTSFADVFLANYFPPFPRASTIAPFYGMTFGGWQEVFWRGTYWGRVYQYDLNKAYRWAACLGLPDMRTSYPTRDWRDPWAIYLVGGKEDERPYCLRGQTGQVITSEERDRFQIMAPDIIQGIGFRKRVDLAPVFSAIDEKFPFCRDRIGRSFWGAWNTNRGPEVWTWKSGERHREMRNPMYNPVWAYFITSRVKMRLAQYRDVALHCFVDSLLTKDALPVGGLPGDFRLIQDFQTVFIRAPGVWGSRDRLVKHCGLTLDDTKG
jgi:hypothetical protein